MSPSSEPAGSSAPTTEQTGEGTAGRPPLDHAPEAGSALLTRRILDALPDITHVYDADWRWTFINPAASSVFRALGREPNALLGRCVWEEFPELVDTLVHENALRAVREQRETVFEHSVHGLDGFYETRVIPIAGGSVSLTRDVSDRRRAELELRKAEAGLRRSNARLRLLTETARRLLAGDRPRDLMASLFEALAPELGLEVYLNFLVDESTGSKRLRLDSSAGVPPDLARELTWLEFGETVCGTVARQRRRIVVDNVQNTTAELTSGLHRLGVTAYVSHPLMTGSELVGTLAYGLRGRPAFRDDELALLQAVADQVAIAIERSRALEAERGARAEAEAASRAKSQFLAIMSHELRTPLTAVIGFADLLANEVWGPTTPAQIRQIDRIKAAAWHLVTIIDEMLSFVRTEAGREAVQIDRTDLARIARETITLLEPQALEKQIGLRLDDRTDPLWIESDPGKVRQILVNLIGNAVKFTKEGEVAVELGREEADRVRVVVRDTGPGIPPEHQERIFEPFVQMDQSNTRTQGGTGLGLAVCRRFARLLGGDVQVRSRPGTGSSFVLTLPCRYTSACE